MIFSLIFVGIFTLTFISIIDKVTSFHTYAKQFNINRLSVLRLSLFSGMFGKGGGSSSKVDSSSLSKFQDSAPTIDILDSMLRGSETIDERENFELQQIGRGSTNARAMVRLFDAPDGFEPKITLYRDSAAWCPYCEKVWLQLEEKRVPYKIVKVPLRCYGEKPMDFYRISPSGGLPAAIINGKTMSESNDIMFAIEKFFSSPGYPSLFPDAQRDPALYDRAQRLLKLERQVFSGWFRWLTASSNEANAMHRTLQQVDQELTSTSSQGPYFLGKDLSLVDIMFTPFLERMAASLPYYKGFLVRDTKNYPALARWYEAMDSRPAYQGIKSDYYTHCHDLPPQIGGCVSEPSAEPFAKKIDGDDWSIQIQPTATFEPMLPLDENIAKREAVRQLLMNFPAIVKFSTRPFGQRNGASVSAELADPNLRANDNLIPIMDSILRQIIHLLLLPAPLPASLSGGSPIIIADEVKPMIKECLIYLRDRIGVPRDMSVHAAKQLRSHINFFLQEFL